MDCGRSPADHPHGPANHNRAFAIGVALNLTYVVAEGFFGFVVHSLALVADAGHNLGDVLSLLLAWGASQFSQSKPSQRYTYGLRSTSILASLANAIILLIAIGAIAWEAIRRLRQPEPTLGGTVMAVAALGVGINAATAFLFRRGREHDLNIKAAFLHMAADAAVSLGVVLAGLAILLTGLQWIDPVTSLVVVGVIALGTWGLLRDSMNLALQAAPGGIDVTEVRNYLCGLPNVTDVHDLHIWPMSTTETALTAHVVRDVDRCESGFLERASIELETQFGIHHATLQVETPDHRCTLAG